MCGEITRWRQVKQFSCEVFFFNAQSWRTLASFGLCCVPIHTNLFKIWCFSYQIKSRDIVYLRVWIFCWLMFAQHGLFEIQLTVYSALSRLTDLGIYYITIYISYSIFPLSTRYEKDYINKITPFIFVQYSKQWSFYTQNLKKISKILKYFCNILMIHCRAIKKTFNMFSINQKLHLGTYLWVCFLSKFDISFKLLCCGSL